VNGVESESASLEYWEQVEHSELPHYASPDKTKADAAKIISLIDPSDKVLDLGCGWGRISSFLVGAGYDVTGIDLSENLVEYAVKDAKRNNIWIPYIVGSMLDIPSTSHVFDVVICMWGAFNHLLVPEEQLGALNQMYRVLIPAGKAIIEMGDGGRKKYRDILANEGYGHDSRVWNSQFNPDTPPNVLYIHDMDSMRRLAERSDFDKYDIHYLTIDTKRRMITTLLKN
jgi:cyclopropane fatty-acyl-phospholipid synthase-like methyltransferase